VASARRNTEWSCKSAEAVAYARVNAGGLLQRVRKQWHLPAWSQRTYCKECGKSAEAESAERPISWTRDSRSLDRFLSAHFSGSPDALSLKAKGLTLLCGTKGTLNDTVLGSLDRFLSAHFSGSPDGPLRACENGHELQLALNSLSRMAEAYHQAAQSAVAAASSGICPHGCHQRL
jgi:hypothetical protein